MMSDFLRRSQGKQP